MDPTDLLPFLLAVIPLLSLAGIALSACARERTHRWIYGILGWTGWIATVALGVFVGFIAIAFSCMGSGRGNDCGDEAAVLIVLGGAFAAIVPGLLAYGLSSRGSPSAPRPPR